MRGRTFPVLVAVLGMAFVAMPSNEASAQPRATCSEARFACGKQRVCRERYRTCMQSGCWAVWRVRRCGYVKE
jgi:hypothetical protein